MKESGINDAETGWTPKRDPNYYYLKHIVCYTNNQSSYDLRR